MPQYMIAGYLPDDFDPSSMTEATISKIHALNEEMDAKGVAKFACGISPASSAKSLRARPDGKVLVTDGPYLETKEHIGGLLILEAANVDEALAWARKGALQGWGPPKCARFFSDPRLKQLRDSGPAVLPVSGDRPAPSAPQHSVPSEVQAPI